LSPGFRQRIVPGARSELMSALGAIARRARDESQRCAALDAPAPPPNTCRGRLRQHSEGVLMISARRVLLLSSLLVATLAEGASQRTFVSAIGVNNPVCSIGAPCRDFASAITATSPGGEVIVLDSGGYGSVAIAQSVSIIASPGVYAGISVFAGAGI